MSICKHFVKLHLEKQEFLYYWLKDRNENRDVQTFISYKLYNNIYNNLKYSISYIRFHELYGKDFVKD